MVKLEQLTKGAQVNGILPNSIVTIVDAQWHGSDVVELTYANTVTVTKNEIITALNKPDSFILAIVEVPSAGDESNSCNIRYIAKPFQNEPDFGAKAR